MERKETYITPICDYTELVQQSLVCTSVNTRFEDLNYGEGDPSIE